MVGVDVARVRGLYPTLAVATAQLDGGFAALSPESVIRAVIGTLRTDPAPPGSRSARSQQSDARLMRTRRAVADLVHARTEDVLLGPSTSILLGHLAALLSDDWRLGDEVVLSRLDTDHATQSWRRAARARGGIVRVAEVDLETGEVPSWQYRDLINPHTRVVTVALGNAATGMVPDVRSIADLAHRHGALVVAEAGVAPLYVPLHLDELGVDLLSVAGPVLGGPTIGAVVARPGLLGELGELTDFGTGVPLPQRFDAAPVPIELLDGFTAAVDHLAELDEHATGGRRQRLVTSVNAAATHTSELYRHLDEGLRSLRGITVLGAADRPLSVAAFTVARHTAADVGSHLQRHRVSVWTGASHLSGVLTSFGADEIGGAVFVGVMPYTVRAEIDQFLDALDKLIR